MVLVNADAAAGPHAVRQREEELVSSFLARSVAVSVLLPPGHDPARAVPYPVLYLNDGQDLERLHLRPTLEGLWARQALHPFVVVAPHANEHRVQEYGIAGHPDYNGRGSRAGAYTEFLLRELLPWAQQHYHATANPAEAVAAGFSLSGLMAFDAVWHHPEAFARAGAFSGSFWWRGRAVGAGYTPADRLMHQRVQAQGPHASHAFWLQTGTLDEHNDRNENGVIDSIEDCLDLMEDLRRQGLDLDRALRYVQIEGGRHHPDTWGWALPDFLRWAFGNAAVLPAPLPVVRLQLDPALTPTVLTEPPAAAGGGPLQLPNATGPLIHALPTAFTVRTTRPTADEFQPYHANYVALVPEGHDPLEALRAQTAEVQALFGALTDEQALKGYAPGKWTPKQVLLHLADAERIFAYRALRFARADAQSLPGFNENDFAAASEANERPMSDLLAEYAAVRAATLALFSSFTEGQLARHGAANGAAVSVRAILFIVPGHERHHLNVFRERYLPVLEIA